MAQWVENPARNNPWGPPCGPVAGYSDRRAVPRPHNPSAIRTLGRTHEGERLARRNWGRRDGICRNTGASLPFQERGKWGRENVSGCPSGTPSPPQWGVKLVDTGCVSSQAKSTFRPGPPLLRKAGLWLPESVSERNGDGQVGKPEEEEEEEGGS